jgi:hypothetical protein
METTQDETEVPLDNEEYFDNGHSDASFSYIC